MLSLFFFLCTTIVLKIGLFLAFQFQMVSRQKDSIEEDIELGAEAEIEPLLQDEVGLDEKGWRRGLYSHKISQPLMCV